VGDSKAGSESDCGGFHAVDDDYERVRVLPWGDGRTRDGGEANEREGVEGRGGEDGLADAAHLIRVYANGGKSHFWSF